MAQAVREGLAILKKAGKEVIIVLDNPRLDFDPSFLANRPINFSHLTKLNKVSNEKLPAYKWYESIIREVAKEFDNVHLVDLFDIFCDDSQCYIMQDDVLLWHDKDHLSIDGSRIATKYIMESYPQLFK